MLKVGAISGYPKYSVRKAAERGGTPADLELTESFKALDEERVHGMWEKALKRRQDDPEGAITTARTLLEQSCKFILDERSEAYPHDADLPKLYALCAKQLNLAPDQHTETAFKTMLGNTQQVGEHARYHPKPARRLARQKPSTGPAEAATCSACSQSSGLDGNIPDRNVARADPGRTDASRMTAITAALPGGC